VFSIQLYYLYLMRHDIKQDLFSSISSNRAQVNPDDLFYIGTGIGLAGGLLCACVIVYFKYKKRKMELESLVVEVAI
jgi:hypothetical protein